VGYFLFPVNFFLAKIVLGPVKNLFTPLLCSLVFPCFDFPLLWALSTSPFFRLFFSRVRAGRFRHRGVRNSSSLRSPSRLRSFAIYRLWKSRCRLSRASWRGGKVPETQWSRLGLFFSPRTSLRVFLFSSPPYSLEQSSV